MLKWWSLVMPMTSCDVTDVLVGLGWILGGVVALETGCNYCHPSHFNQNIIYIGLLLNFHPYMTHPTPTWPIPPCMTYPTPAWSPYPCMTHPTPACPTPSQPNLSQIILYKYKHLYDKIWHNSASGSGRSNIYS